MIASLVDVEEGDWTVIVMMMIINKSNVFNALSKNI